jgi:lysophospholipase L1-like esterase
MWTIVIISNIINLIFLSYLGYFIYIRGGRRYIKEQIGSFISNHSSKPNWYYKNNKYWQLKKELHEIMHRGSDEIIFLGDAFTAGCDWYELFNNPSIKNRGITGDNTEGMLERLTKIIDPPPLKVFIEIGSTDLGLKISMSEIIKNYELIIDRFTAGTSKTKVYVQSVLPVNRQADRNNDSIICLNNQLQKMALKKQVKYLDIYNKFTDSSGALNMFYTYDGKHLNSKGYLVWKEAIEKYVNE